MKPALFQRLPWWLWLGWAVHLMAYALPSYEAASGLKCAYLALQMWFSTDGLWRQVGAGDMAAVRGMAILGWFNVTNLAAIFAPWLVSRGRRPALAWWTALLCLTGAVQAVAFGFGLITEEPEYPSLRIGFYVWLLSYAWLATGTFVVWRRIRTSTTTVKTS